MEQPDTETKLVFDFPPQIVQPGFEIAAPCNSEPPAEISLHCEEDEGGGTAPGSQDATEPELPCSPSVNGGSGAADEVPAFEPVAAASGEELAAELSASLAADSEVMIPVEEDTEGVAAASGVISGLDAAGSAPVKRKRGRPRKNPEARTAPPVKKKEREDVCFVCFDRTNPNLVPCNRRGCFKAYHTLCVNRDETFFHSKGKWNCGCHICSNCQKAAQFLCYTCTTSYCKVCIPTESKYVSVRGNYGFCQSCHNTVTLIELNKLACEKKDDTEFDDTDSFTYLFKSYWLDLKGKLSMTSDELNNARHPYSVVHNEESSDELYDANEDQGSSSEGSLGHREGSISSKKNVRRRSQAFAVDQNRSKEVDVRGTLVLQETGWASKELLELVAHMRNGDQSFISQFDVQALLLEYIKKYNLRDPRRRSQIICDTRLRNLFGKERVGHFEMLKLLESHFLSKEVPQIGVDGNSMETSDLDYKLTDDVEEGDILARVGSEKRRKNRKRTEEREMQTNLDDFAAVDVHNITQIFLRRSLVEELLDDIETFNDRVVGSFVRIRISNASQRQDLYRLVQVVGTQESTKLYKVGKKTIDIVLEILNLDKKETSTIDSISNQDFTEEECQRLRQSIKCGLIDRLKVGDIQEKAKDLHAVRVKDSLETEKLRLSHLRDRASETGRRKELRECIEKLQLLNRPEERRRRMNEVPEIHTDPKMDPEYESSEGGEDGDKNEDSQIRSNEAFSQRKGRALIPRGRASNIIGNNWNGMRESPNSNRESSRRLQGEVAQDRSDMYNNMAERPNEILQNLSKELHQTQASFTDLQTPSQGTYGTKFLGQPNSAAPEIISGPPGCSLPSIPNEVDKIWHYQDPSKNIQGPFSLTQLRKWNVTGYFPPDLRVWKTAEKREDYILLTDLLAGRYYKDPPQQVTQHSSSPHQHAWADRQKSRDNWNAAYDNAASALTGNINLPTFDALPSQSPVWSTTMVEMPNSSEGRPSVYPSTWSSNPRPVAPINHNPYQIPTCQETGSGGWSQAQDYGNTWSPTRPRNVGPSVTPNVAENLLSALPVVSGSSSANEVNGGMNKYRAFESDCPSPTPRTERKVSPLLQHDELVPAKVWPEVLDRPASNTTVPAGNLEVHYGSGAPYGKLDPSSNTISAGGLTDQVPGSGMPKLNSSKSISSEFQSNLSPVAAASDDTRFSATGSGHVRSDLSPIHKLETGFQAMDHASIQKRLSVGSSLTPPSLHGLEHDQNQNTQPNLSPIRQANLQNVSEVECSLPSPTPRNDKNAAGSGSWGTDASSASHDAASLNQKTGTVQTVEYANTPWDMATQGHAGWGTPTYGNANANTGLGTPLQGIANTNTGLGTPLQGIANTNTGLGTPLQGIANVNTGWGTPAQGNANVNAGWGTPVQGNTNATTGWGMPVHVNANVGWGMPIQVNANAGWGTPAQGNANPNTGWGTVPQGRGWGTGLEANTTSVGWESAKSGATWQDIPIHEDGANIRAGWGSASGNRNGGWKSSDRDTSRRVDYEGFNGDRYPHHRDRDMGYHGGIDPRNNKMQSGDSGGSSWQRQPSPGGDGQRGVCKFFENGHCKKGRSCKYLHTSQRRNT